MFGGHAQITWWLGVVPSGVVRINGAGMLLGDRVGCCRDLSVVVLGATSFSCRIPIGFPGQIVLAALESRHTVRARAVCSTS